jgi:ADP-heptose:LPS heptosyltransferase
VIHPFSGGRRKNWPLEQFCEISRRLPMPVQWCAGPEESLHSAVRMENLWDLACWLAAARVYIGNDSGITHLAAAVGTPTVAIFGPSDPAIWGPRGEHVKIVTEISGDISTDFVFREAMQLLGMRGVE